MSTKPSFLIRNATIIDGTGNEPARDWALAVEGRRIAWMGPSDDAPSFNPEDVVDAGGRTLLPGLINCHTHLCNDGAADFFGQVINDSVPIATLRGLVGAKASLDAGVTTVRDCGAANGVIIELAKAIDLRIVAGPRIKAAGRVITMTGGHCYFFGREVDGRDDVRKATRAEIKGGADFIKVMATGGVLTPGVDPRQTALQPDELDACVQEAHNAGKRTACHAIGNAGIKNALRAGVDSIEHGFYLDDEAIELALKTGAFMVPTLVAVNAVIDHGLEGGIASWVVEKAKAEAGHHVESFKAAVRSGMKIAAGTDAGTPFNPHGDISVELAIMVELGLTPMEAIVSATRGAAENLDTLHEIGTLEVGKLADLIVVDGDPLDDIYALRRPQLVAKDGIIYRNELATPGTRPMVEN
jgi:imidazolonepropionase-like amidohydrolase